LRRGQGLVTLWDLCRILRGEGGCPWDKEQTPATLTPYLVEETYEILESVSHDDWPATAEELGDLLFLLMFLAEMVEERGGPGLDELAAATDRKLRRRHPHLFGESPEVISSSDQQRRWQHLKQAEKGSASVLGQIPAGAPSLTAAYRTQEKASSVGFDWPDVNGVIAKIEEELAEVKEAMARREHGEEELRHEIGDLLFAVTNLARYLRVDPESELRSTVRRFRGRFLHVEERLAESGKTPSESTLDEMDALWNEAKAKEREEKR
jgi:tetrapyrrole methylase family protein/MazG family protein